VKILAIYETDDGKKPYQIWLGRLKDKMIIARIMNRLERIKEENFGDTKSVGKGVHELRFHFGSGYRIYYGLDGENLIILLIGGDKSDQERDIKFAHQYWEKYLKRVLHEKN